MSAVFAEPSTLSAPPAAGGAVGTEDTDLTDGFPGAVVGASGRAADRPGNTDSHHHPDVASLEADELAYAADLAGGLINLIKQFGALKVRLVPTGDYDVTQTFLLVRLVERGPIRATELAELACADPSTISRQVAGLVKAGLVERQADPADGRASLLVATDAGRAHLDHHRRLRGLALGPLVADWSEQDRTDFLRLLRRLTRELDAHRDDIAAMLAQHRTDGSN